MTDATGLSIRRATCRTMFVFDVGREIDVAAARRLVPELVRDAPAAAWRSPAVRVESPPLRLAMDTAHGAVSVGVYQFGAVALTYAVPVAGTLADLRDASCKLAADAALPAAARRDATAVLAALGAAVIDPALSDVTEDYVVYEVTDFASDIPLSEVPGRLGQELAQVLRSETQDLSEQEVAHAVGTRVMRTPGDLVILDWNAAFVFHPAPAEILEVLELANVQLLEMRFLDRRLDEALQESYETVSRKRFWRPVFLPDALRESMRRVAQRQVDAAVLHERVGNALKLVGDQYLARIYRRAASRFELAEWNAANLQKLATLDSIYEKLHDRAAIVRAEVLEWIVILLIAAELTFGFLRG